MFPTAEQDGHIPENSRCLSSSKTSLFPTAEQFTRLLNPSCYCRQPKQHQDLLNALATVSDKDMLCLFEEDDELLQSLQSTMAREGCWADQSASISCAATILTAAADTISWLLTAQVCKPSAGPRLRAYGSGRTRSVRNHSGEARTPMAILESGRFTVSAGQFPGAVASYASYTRWFDTSRLS